MVMCQAPHNLCTSRSSPLVPAPPIPARTFPPTLLFLLLSLPSHANFVSIPSLLPTALQRGTFLLGGCSPCIHYTFSFPPSLHAALLPSLAAPLYLGSPIGHVPPLHIPNTLLAMLFPHGDAPYFPPPSSCTLYLTRTQTYCPLPLTSSFFLPRSPSAYSGRPSGQTTHICDTFGHSSFLSSSQCMPRYRAL